MTDWTRCHVGSCQRHKECMYKPCRQPQGPGIRMSKTIIDINFTYDCTQAPGKWKLVLLFDNKKYIEYETDYLLLEGKPITSYVQNS